MTMSKINIILLICIQSSICHATNKSVLMNGTHDNILIEYQICQTLEKKPVCNELKSKTLSLGQKWIPEHNVVSYPVYITKIKTSTSEKNFPNLEEFEKIPINDLRYVRFCRLSDRPVAITVFANEVFCSTVPGV